MVAIKKIVLDVLKPHQPSAIEFSRTIASTVEDCQVRLKVLEMDENTESLMIEITGQQLDFEKIQAAINDLGGSLHSIDEVEVHSENDAGGTQ